MTKSKNLNAELYSSVLFDYWANQKNLNAAEAYLFKTYLTDTSKRVLEAGTGGGRISFQIEDMGFRNITAFDFLPKMINHAKVIANEKGSKINFKVSDATNLIDYKTESFDYLVGMSQVLCFIDQKEMFLKALNEMYRVAKKDGVIILSFLDFDSRFYNRYLSLLVNIFRKLRGEEYSKQHLPWLKLNKKFNWKLFHKDQAKTYWLKKDEITSQLKSIGFSVLEVKNDNHFSSNEKKGKGMLYVVCRK